MSSKKRSKVETDSDSDSGPDDRNVPQKKGKPDEKKTASASRDTNADGEERFMLAKKRYLTVREFKGRVMVDIREFYEDNNGDLKPGKKGICLQLDQWNALKGHIDDIDAAIQKH